MNHAHAPQALPTYFISHGGGPWPWMKKEMGHTYDKLEAALADMPRQIGRTPDALLMVSAHWEEPAFTVMGNPRPPMIYDYGGFPAHTPGVALSAIQKLFTGQRFKIRPRLVVEIAPNVSFDPKALLTAFALTKNIHTNDAHRSPSASQIMPPAP